MNPPHHKVLRRSCTCGLIASVLLAAAASASDRVAGSAVVIVDQNEYLIPIECKDALQPSQGINTEPARITREATGRTSGVRLNIRPWQDTDYVIVSLDRYVAWIPMPESSGSSLSLRLDMSPTSRVVNGFPQTLTFDQWMAGEREAGIRDVRIEANCGARDLKAPAYRKIPANDSA